MASKTSVAKFSCMNWFSFLSVRQLLLLLLWLVLFLRIFSMCSRYLDGPVKWSIVLTQGYCTDTQFCVIRHCIIVSMYLLLYSFVSTTNIYTFCAVNRRSDFWLNLKLTLRFERNMFQICAFLNVEHIFVSSFLSSTVADWLDIFKTVCGLRLVLWLNTFSKLIRFEANVMNVCRHLSCVFKAKKFQARLKSRNIHINIRHIAIKQVIQLIIEFNQSQLTKLNWSISIAHIHGKCVELIWNWGKIEITFFFEQKRMTKKNSTHICAQSIQTCLLIKFVDRMGKREEENKWRLGHFKSCTKHRTHSTSAEKYEARCARISY